MKKKDIEFLKMTVLRGPNMWTYHPVLEALVDIGELEDFPSNTIPGFYERLAAWLPTLVEHRCSVGERGGFLKRLREGTWAGHVLEHVTLELQDLAGLPGGFGRARETLERGVYKVVVSARHEKIAEASLVTARDLVMAAIENRAYDVDATVAGLRDLVDRYCLGPSTACIVEAAGRCLVPVLRLTESNLVQLGYGVRQRRIWTAETDRTSAIAEGISRDKNLTKHLLGACGIPVPEGRLVESADDAWEAAEDIGLPVVVKPYDGNHGRGVFTNLGTREEIAAAYAIAVEEGSGVLVERFISGNEHRLLIVGEKLVAAAMGRSAWVTGDGMSTVRQLVEAQLNTDPRRGNTENHPLNPVHINSSVRVELRRQGLDADSIPEKDRTVLIQSNGNVAYDVTERVHPSVSAHAALAACVVGLDIAGIDLVCGDISRPLEEQGGAIVEVNAGPGLLMHIRPAEGSPRPVGEAIISHLFPDGDNGRIPVVGISGTNGKTDVARLIKCILQLSGKNTGLACSDGMYLGGRRVEAGDHAHWASARRILMNRSVDVAVLENDSGVILREGLVYDRCQVGVVTNMDTPDHLENLYIDDVDKMFSVLRTQVDVVLPSGVAVLNARDPMVAGMAELCDGTVTFFGLDPECPVIREHCASGGRAVFVRDGWIALAEDGHETALVGVSRVPLTLNGRVPWQVENVMAALGTAWALGVSAEIMCAGVTTFDYYQSDAPGRFTLTTYRGATIIVDDPHNVSALRAVVMALDNFPASERSIVFAVGEDRRDADLSEQGQCIADVFDRVILTSDDSVQRGRSEAQLLAALRQGLAQGRRVTLIEEQPDRTLAVAQALERLRPGELLLVQTEEGNIATSVELVRQHIGQSLPL